MEHYKTPYPVRVCLLGSDAIVLQPYFVSNLIQQTRCGANATEIDKRETEKNNVNQVAAINRS